MKITLDLANLRCDCGMQLSGTFGPAGIRVTPCERCMEALIDQQPDRPGPFLSKRAVQSAVESNASVGQALRDLAVAKSSASSPEPTVDRRAVLREKLGLKSPTDRFTEEDYVLAFAGPAPSDEGRAEVCKLLQEDVEANLVARGVTGYCGECGRPTINAPSRELLRQMPRRACLHCSSQEKHVEFDPNKDKVEDTYRLA